VIKGNESGNIALDRISESRIMKCAEKDIINIILNSSAVRMMAIITRQT